MRFRIVNCSKCALVCLIFLCCACKDDDTEAPLKEIYTKEWVLDINEYLGADPKVSSTYSAVVIDNTRLLVSHNTGTMGTLVEIDHNSGTFIRQKSTNNDSVRVSISSEKVLMIHEDADTKNFSIEIYDPEDGEVEFVSTLQASALSPPGGNFIGLTPDPYEVLYTYGSVLNYDGEEVLWIGCWYYDGTKRWMTTFNTPFDVSTFSAHLATDRQLIFSAQREFQGNTYWEVGAASFWDGGIDSFQAAQRDAPVHVVENPMSKWLYVFSSMGFFSIDHYGQQVFTNPMAEFATGTLSTKPLIMGADLMFLAVHEGNNILLVSGSVEETRWEEKYWESTTAPLILLATSTRDVLVVSGNGFVTKYKWNP